jgi:UDP-N-acetylmuramate dehydrogenase
MIYKKVSLKKYNSFGLDYRADYFIKVQTEEEAILVLNNHGSLKKPLFVLGGGSNLLFTSDFEGTIIHPEITGIEIVEKRADHVIVSAGAGVIWDDLVSWTVSKGFGGLENLSLIPGLVGATPVQNIGAYGVEVKDSIIQIRAISLDEGKIREFTKEECRFGYRDSIFKNENKRMYLITRVYYKLIINPFLKTNYGSLKEEVGKLGGYTLENVRQAVINIRKSKLPDPTLIGNAGSFFKNPVVDNLTAKELKNLHPQIPIYNDLTGGKKLAAGWLIDQCGWKGKRRGNAGVHDKQALVLVNYGDATGPEILELAEEIKQSVSDRFGIELDREVEVI